MPTLSDIFNLDPNVERLTLLPRLRGSLPSEKSVMMPDRYMFDVIAPKFLYDFIRAVKSPGRAAKGEALDEEEALNTAMNMFGGGLATSGSVPLGALGMSARTAPAGSIPLREVPRSPLGFYSKVEEATLPLQNKGSGSQFLAQIQKTPGVKPEEIEVLGLDKFLQSKPTVTKQEIQEYITANKPDVQETILGGGADIRAKADIDYAEGRLTRDEYNQILETSGKPSKFGSYTIPGGENYRELLLTLKTSQKKLPMDEFLESIGQKYGDNTPRNQWSPEDNATYERLLREDPLIPRTPVYRTGHFDEPNILTHLRANDRVIDGKKALFIEEIQSDWHQAGRKKGYGPQTETTVQAYYIGANGDKVPLGYGATKDEAAASLDPKWFNLVDVKFDSQTKKVGEGVPDAPFKKSWHELALKRAIQEAVDKGYDKLAFTTGKTQAERYDLSKQVNKIDVESIPEARGVQFVDVYTNDGKTIFLEIENGVIREGQYAGKQLDEVVGKELSQRITSLPAGEKIKIEGEDLSIGGQGMKGFYDEILPKALQNLTKKYGTKVTKSKLDEGSEVWSMDITPQMREQIKSKGQPLFATAPPLGLATQDPLEQFLQTDEARNDPFMQFLGYNR